MKNNTQKSIVKEPEGVDFLVKSAPWTPEERAEFSAFLLQKKAKRQQKVPNNVHI
jgi:hypothetical protein